MAVDPQFGVDDFNRAKILNEAQTIAYNILTLLFGKPGFYPSIPRLGMDIKQYFYSFAENFDTESLKTQLASQCRDFLSVIRDGSFDIIQDMYDDQPLLIFIIPTVLVNTPTNLLLGLVMNGNGEYKFNFTFDVEQTI